MVVIEISTKLNPFERWNKAYQPFKSHSWTRKFTFTDPLGVHGPQVKKLHLRGTLHLCVFVLEDSVRDAHLPLNTAT